MATLATKETLAPDDVRTALGVFEFAPHAAPIWRGSKMDQKREILETLSLNRLLGDVTRFLENRKPFDELAKRPSATSSRGDKTAIELIPPPVRLWSRPLFLATKDLVKTLLNMNL